MRRSPAAVVAVAVALLAAASPSQAPVATQEPTFTTGDLAKLSCRVVSAPKDSTLLEVEVRNAGDVAAEPLSFAIAQAARGRKQPAVEHTISRARLPLLRRYGRPVAPGATQRYWLRTSLEGDHKKLQVAVREACFHDGAAVPAPTGVVGDIEHVKRESLIGTFAIGKVSLHNPFDHDADFLLRVKLTQPRDQVELYGVRVRKGTTLEWLVSTVPSDTLFLDNDGAPGCAMKVAGVELVDWLLVGTPDEESAKRDFLAAYERWKRWPEPRPTVRGSFAIDGEKLRDGGNTTEAFAAKGRFTLRPDGTVTVDGDDPLKQAPRAIADAFADLLRRSPDDVRQKNRFYGIVDGRIELHGPSIAKDQTGAQVGADGATPGSGTYPWYEIVDGRLAGLGWENRPFEQWRTRDLGDGYVIVRRAFPDPGYWEEFTWREVDGLCMPATWQKSEKYGEVLLRRISMQLSDLTTEGGAASSAPDAVGEGAEALRATWDTGPRVPSEPLSIVAQVDVRNPGTDDVWAGHAKVAGTLRMRGVGRHCEAITFDSGGRLDEATERTLATVIHDRLMMWWPHDLNDRPPFDDTFRGARIDAPTSAGKFVVHDCPITEVHVADGRITRLVGRDGRDRRYHYGKVGDLEVVDRIEDREAVVSVTLQLIDGHLLPTRLHLERIFGRDWGPETITLRNLQIR